MSGDCPRCRGTRTVCENHPDHPWEINRDETCCDGAGMFCPDCAAPPPPPPGGPGWFDLQPPTPRVSIRAGVALLGGPRDGWPTTADVGPDQQPPPLISDPDTPGGFYARTDRTVPNGAGGTLTVYRWQPAATGGRRTPTSCQCGGRGCPNATRRQP